MTNRHSKTRFEHLVPWLIIGMIILLAVVPASAYDYRGVPKPGDNNLENLSEDISSSAPDTSSVYSDLFSTLSSSDNSSDSSSDITSMILQIIFFILRLFGTSLS